MLTSSWVGIEVLESRIAPATIVVTTLKDIVDPVNHTSGSLRDAIILADSSPDSEIVFKAGLRGTIKLSNVLGDLPAITADMSIEAPLTKTGQPLITIHGNNHRIFKVDSDTPTDVSISGLILKGGRADAGGAVFIDDVGGSVTLEKCVLTGNKAVGARFTESNTLLAAKGGGIDIVNGNVTIKDSKITGNLAIGPNGFGETSTNRSQRAGGAAFGGGIYIGAEASLIVEKTTISGNSARGGAGGHRTLDGSDGGFGGDAYGGGIFNAGTFSGEALTISGNTAFGGKGGNGQKGANGLNNDSSSKGDGHQGGDGGGGGEASGGGVLNKGSMSLMTSTISGNLLKGGLGGNGAAGGNGGNGVASRYGNTYAGNGGQGGSGGDGGYANGAGLLSGGTKLTMEVCTISGNIAANQSSGLPGAGGKVGSGPRDPITQGPFRGDKGDYGFPGLSNGGGLLSSGGALDLSLVTIAKNTGVGAIIYVTDSVSSIHNCTIAFNSGGLSASSDAEDHALNVVSTIVALNRGFDVEGIFNSDHNLIQKTAEGVVTGPNDIVGVNPKLGALGKHGGSTLTLVPLPGSPVINKGANPDALITDQRGRQITGQIDIGAVEVG